MDLLKRLEAGHVFSVSREGDQFAFTEECDRYFQEFLTRDEVRKLAAELTALADAE